MAFSIESEGPEKTPHEQAQSGYSAGSRFTKKEFVAVEQVVQFTKARIVRFQRLRSGINLKNSE